ncbi:ribulose-phosphate 3-epimerase [Mobilisporobacter senegalensis]|uniref:Ribulose-phosphate 3-epimerase n=1 Tax=Mobilisporobacter senegalensis TaxID=1329262 RepID=A0A3N1XVT7_9FIRM|nr:ribulose-phosphate 3-epimerase [Mobilisporobacter senegalensis]ROR30730.1 ribulose-phosphate 3-epimerase [Mobilisporobacter senegalensis]
MNVIAPSILAADITKLGEEVRTVDQLGAEYIHIDVMDGMFVPSISYGIPIVKGVREITNKILDVHLMIEDPTRYIEEFVKAGADIITVHVEACKHLHRTVSRIKELGVKAGVSLNPSTPLSSLDYILSEVDMVLIMSVNPGFGGQSFIPFSIDKIKELRNCIVAKGLSVDIEVDGGINLGNVGEILKAGANVIVAGTSIFSGDVESNMNQFRRELNSVS